MARPPVHGRGSLPDDGIQVLSAGAPRVFLAEDDPAVSEVLSAYLTRDGLAVDSFADGLAARERLAAGAGDYALFVIDLKLPRLSGERLCLAARAATSAPIIVISGKPGVDVAAASLELGADDFLAKPFSPRELVARARAKLRAGDAGDLSARLEAGGITVDPIERKAVLAGRELDLNQTELKLLYCLVSARGGFVHTENLARAARVAPHAVPAAMRKLRSALGSADRRIEYAGGQGYRLNTTNDGKGTERR